MGVAVTVLCVLAFLGCLFNPTWTLCAFVFALVIRPNENIEGVLLPVLPIALVLVAVLYFVHYSEQLPRPGGVLQWSTIFMLSMVALLAAHLVIWNRWELTRWFWGEGLPVLLLTLFATRYLADTTRLRAFFISLGLASLVVAGQAFFVHYFFKQPPFIIRGVWGNQISHGALWDSYHMDGQRLMGRVTSIWGNSNDLGMVCNWGLAVCFYFLKRQGHRVIKVVSLAASALFVSTILLTGSRGGLVQLGISLWVLIAGGRRKVLGIVLLVLVLGTTLVVLPRIAPDRTDEGASKEERTALAREALRLFVANPLMGVGYLNFPNNAFRRLMPHNVYAQCLSETGLLGAALFFPLLFLLRRETVRACRYYEALDDVELNALARCISALQLGFLIFMLFSNQFMRFTFALAMVGGMALHVMMLREVALTSQQLKGRFVFDG